MAEMHDAQGGPPSPLRRIPKRGWIAVAVALLVLAVAVAAVVAGGAGRVAALSYGAFLDQVDAGNVAAVTFQGTAIDGRLRRPLAAATAQGAAASAEDFTSRVPDFGDPELIPMLRQHRVAIDVASPSSWTWLLERVPWPMLLFIVALLVAGFVRLVRGSHGGPTMGIQAGGPMAGLLAALAARRHGAEAQSKPDRGDGG